MVANHMFWPLCAPTYVLFSHGTFVGKPDDMTGGCDLMGTFCLSTYKCTFRLRMLVCFERLQLSFRMAPEAPPGHALAARVFARTALRKLLSLYHRCLYILHSETPDTGVVGPPIRRRRLPRADGASDALAACTDTPRWWRHSRRNHRRVRNTIAPAQQARRKSNISSSGKRY